MRERPDAFTLVELLTVIAIMTVLGALIMGALSKVNETERQTVCVSNLRQWGVALNLYVADHNGCTPRRGQGVQPFWITDQPDDWFNALPPYLGLPAYSDQVNSGHPALPTDKSVFVCPSAVEEPVYPNFLCYGMNMYLSPKIRPNPHRLAELPNLSQLVFMADGPGGWCSTVPSSQGYSVKPRHNGRANVIFCDGHVQSFDGDYLGCGKGEPNPELPDVRWQTLSDGVNQAPVP